MELIANDKNTGSDNILSISIGECTFSVLTTLLHPPLMLNCNMSMGSSLLSCGKRLTDSSDANADLIYSSKWTMLPIKCGGTLTSAGWDMYMWRRLSGYCLAAGASGFVPTDWTGHRGISVRPGYWCRYLALTLLVHLGVHQRNGAYSLCAACDTSVRERRLQNEPKTWSNEEMTPAWVARHKLCITCSEITGKGNFFAAARPRNCSVYVSSLKLKLSLKCSCSDGSIHTGPLFNCRVL